MPQKSPALTDAQSPSCGAFLSGQIHTGIWLRESVWFEEGLSAVKKKIQWVVLMRARSDSSVHR